MTDQFPHVCFVAPNAYPVLTGNEEIQVIGGAELQVAIVARLLAARGRRVSMICLDFGQQDEIEIDGVKIFRAYKPDEGIPMLRFLWPRLTSIWSCLKRAKADVYYQQTAGMVTGVMAAFCKIHDRKSVFASASNPDLFVNTPRIQYARDRWIYEYGLRHVDRIFVQNDEQARLCRLNFAREPVLVRNCYPMPAKRVATKDSGYILWVSTIRNLKRPDLFLDLAQALPDQEFRMIGGPADGEARLFESIKARASAMSNVRFLGFLPFPRTEEQFDGALVFVNTSDSEGFPNTFLQAWARAVPTVSFVSAGACLDGRPIGLTVKSFDELVATIVRLVANEAARLKEGEHCATYVERNHSPEQIVQLYEHQFEEIVRSGSPADDNVACPSEESASGDSQR